jgi:hypothetical protein
MDASGNILVTQAISGYLETTSYTEFGSRWIVVGSELNDDWEASGAFIITPVPTSEPSSGLLLCAGVLCLALGRKRLIL